MKILLATLVTLASMASMADIPMPQPRVEPGPQKSVDAEALNVLIYGSSAAKQADLKAGSNTMAVQRQGLKPGVTRYTYTSRNCSYGIAGNLCLENKQMSITKTEKVSPDRLQVSYQVSEVMKLR
jgi:hypothetical protein